MDFGTIPREWLIKKVALENCERDHTTRISLGDSQSVVPFGYQNEKWVHLKSLMQANDEIWDFESPGDYWDSLCGRSGVALVRNDEIIFTITSVMN